MSSDIIRRASVAGSFYPSIKSDLLQQIEDSFIKDYGPGKIPEIKKMVGSLKGVVVPHAGISFSGSIAAHSYLSIAEDGFADAFIIIGPNHQGIGSNVALYPKGNWETPLGSIKMDDRLIENLNIFNETITKAQINININHIPISMFCIADRITYICKNGKKSNDRTYWDEFLNKKNSYLNIIQFLTNLIDYCNILSAERSALYLNRYIH